MTDVNDQFIDIDLSVNLEVTPNPKLPAITDPATGKVIPPAPSSKIPPLESFISFLNKSNKKIEDM